jgi:hypothetical protein
MTTEPFTAAELAWLQEQAARDSKPPAGCRSDPRRGGALRRDYHRRKAPLAVTVTGLLDQPLPAYLYFDVVRGWVKRPLAIREQQQLRLECPNLYIDNITAKFDWRYQQRLQLPQPSEAALRLLIDFTDDDALLNYHEIALDLLPPERPSLGHLLDLFQHGFVQPWHAGHQMHWFADGFSTSRFTRGEPPRGHYFNPYADEPCRIDGHQHCLHIDSRIHGAGAARRLGIHRPSDLLQFDFVSYWRKWLRLYHIDFERLGRFDANRSSGSSRRQPRIAQWGRLGTVNMDKLRGARLYHLLALDRGDGGEQQRSLQHFVDSYGRGPYLTRMPVHIYDMSTNDIESSEVRVESVEHCTFTAQIRNRPRTLL